MHPVPTPAHSSSTSLSPLLSLCTPAGYTGTTDVPTTDGARFLYPRPSLNHLGIAPRRSSKAVCSSAPKAFSEAYPACEARPRAARGAARPPPGGLQCAMRRGACVEPRMCMVAALRAPLGCWLAGRAVVSAGAVVCAVCASCCGSCVWCVAACAVPKYP